MNTAFSAIADILNAVKAGRMVILVDDEDRENEGDLVIPAVMADAGAINFMAKYGRGLICLALTPERVAELELPLMAAHNESRHQTAFTTSIEAREGVTTGISAADRARTIAVAIDPNTSRRDLSSPGHVFPLVARAGGVLVRAGHTEAAVDIARLAGLNPSGVICEIMNDDGGMARVDDLIPFAKRHGLKIAAISDLIAYRRRTEKIVQPIFQSRIDTRKGGEFDLFVYVNTVSYAEHIALVKGAVGGSDEPILVRVHALNVLEDVLGDRRRGHGGELQAAMKMIADAGRGVIVLIRETSQRALSDRLKNSYTDDHASDADSGGASSASQLRDYGVGAQILLDLGVRDMILLTNTRPTLVGLEGYGLRVVGHRPLDCQTP